MRVSHGKEVNHMCKHQRQGYLQADPCDEPYYGCMDCGKPIFIARWARKIDLTRNARRIATKELTK